MDFAKNSWRTGVKHKNNPLNVRDDAVPVFTINIF